MTEITKVRFAEYSLIFTGNDGEEQLVIVMGAGQGGDAGFRIVYATVDNGNVPATKERHFKQTKRGAFDSTNQAEQTLLKIVTEWIEDGLPGNTAPSIKKAEKALKKFLYL